MNTLIHFGNHIIANIHNVKNVSRLNDAAGLASFLSEVATSNGFTVLGTLSHDFEPQGATAIVMLSESHISIHTWPESQSAAFDVFTCGPNDPQKILDSLINYLDGDYESSIVSRVI